VSRDGAAGRSVRNEAKQQQRDQPEDDPDPSFPAKTIPELFAYTKANPEKVNFASAGTGSVAHMAGELFMAIAGVNWCTCLIAASARR
jgi:hypothetical protein